MGIYLLVGFLGLVCGFFSGLLGIGGGIIMAPLLLYLPPLLGFAPLSMHTIAGLTIIQGLVACVSGVVVHKHFKAVSGRLTAWMGTAIFLAALLGGAGAGYVSQQVLLFIFGILALLAAILMLVPAISEARVPTVENLAFSRWRALLSGSAVGLLGGMVGQGGSFILIPLMTSFVRIPTRIAIGSNLGIVLLSSVAGFLGKAFTGQIEWLLAVPLVITVVPAAQAGGILSHRMPVAMLRRILGGIIFAAAVRIL
ncbi:MAG: sulfite exporter TauE/SafE family protein, partial [Deltaproteobacteria bacterium]|nr:sulfite exporter TauE/SafE family protein [Deltaproteobacteria bacterium]